MRIVPKSYFLWFRRRRQKCLKSSFKITLSEIIFIVTFIETKSTVTLVLYSSKPVLSGADQYQPFTLSHKTPSSISKLLRGFLVRALQSVWQINILKNCPSTWNQIFENILAINNDLPIFAPNSNYFGIKWIALCVKYDNFELIFLDG